MAKKLSKKRLSGMQKINTLSLFAGAGGLDIGFHQAGYNILGCVEIEEKYCRTLEENRKLGTYISQETNIHNIDIRDFDVSPYLSKKIDCIIGGPPCQTFSSAGRRAGGVIGTDDERGQLYAAYCKILYCLKPKVFVFENVYGLRGANGGKPWLEIQRAFAENGYTLHAEVIDAADYGVPQHRERLIMIGARKNLFRFPLPTVGPDSPSGAPLVSAESAILDLQKPGEKYGKGLGGMYGHLLPDVPEGLNYSYFTAEMGHPEPVFAWRSKFHDLLYKASRKEPCRTLKANPGKFTGPFHWKNRHFTLAELKRLQTFPDDYEIVGTYTQVVEQIGNSVPPLLAKIIAESVKEQIFNPSDQLNYPLRKDGFQSTFRARQRERTNNFKKIAQEAIKTKYGKLRVDKIVKGVKPKTKEYLVAYTDRFSRNIFFDDNSTFSNYLSCTLTEIGNHIRLDCDAYEQDNFPDIDINISINGLKKYLPNFDSLKLQTLISSEETIFQCWKEIEAILVERSNFFTLIDIYGHYANRGDVVEIKTSIHAPRPSKLWNLIEYFSQTKNCGGFLKETFIMELFDLTRLELYELINLMRKLRYDIRTDFTHPIIGAGNIICTYPFPLLSPKAFVESKAKLLKEPLHEREIR